MPVKDTVEAGPAELTQQTDIRSNGSNGSGQVAVETVAVASAATPAPDLVRLIAQYVDFGDDPFDDVVLHAPLGFGVLTWDTSGSTVRPTLEGKLYMNNSLGREAKMQMRYRNVFGDELETKYGGSVTPTSSGLHKWTVNLSPYANPAIYSVEISVLVHYTGTTWWVYARDTYNI